jgi:hypothetical protein
MLYLEDEKNTWVNFIRKEQSLVIFFLCVQNGSTATQGR